MVGINGYNKSNKHLDAVHTENAKRAGGVKAKNGEGKLSKKAADFLAKLREERPDFDFQVSGGKDLRALATDTDKEYSVIFDAEELEKMADDENYAQEKLNHLDTIVKMSDKITKDAGFASLLGETAEGNFFADAINFSVKDNGEIKIFADIKKAAEEKAEQAKETDKPEKKSLNERDVREKAEAKKAFEPIKIEALSVEDFLQKLRNIA
ncbi:MAG: hypothetical protein IKR39_03805 [Lachnospiraceae bacterium]|nr:hypothetical protein [Lachnospiraceae bacterium]